jgi:large subunit ribosomal protein L4
MATKATTKNNPVNAVRKTKRVLGGPKPVVEKKLLTGAATEATIYSMDGKTTGTVTLPSEIFAVRWNADLVHQVVIGMQANARPITAHTKNRGEVRGGGKKPWKQKGTGRARHGSSRSPIWRGGGVTFGPRAERVFEVKINKKMRIAALLAVLSKKAKDGEIIFIDKLSFDAPKTSAAKAMLVAVAAASNAPKLITKPKNAALIAFANTNINGKKSLSNIGSIDIEEIRNLNPVDVLSHKYLVIEQPTRAIEVLTARATK